MSIVAALNREAKALWGEGRGKSLVAIAVGWGMLVGTRMIYPVLLPYFRDSYGLSLAAAGLLVTILWLSGAIGQLPGGVLADRYSERDLMVSSTIVVAVALVFVVTASTTTVLFAATGLVGLGLSLYPIARITILSKIYTDRIGSALGTTMATGDLGQTVLPPVAGLLAIAITWQVGLLFVIPLFLLVGTVLWVTLPAQSPWEHAATGETNEHVERAESIEGVGSVGGGGGRRDSGGVDSIEGVGNVSEALRRPTMVLVAVILFLFIFIWQSFSGFYPTYLIEEKGLSSSVASGLFGLFFAFGIVVKPLAGVAYDRIGMRASLVAVLVGPVAGLVLLPTVEGFWSLVAVTALVSTMLGTGAITQSHLSDSFPVEMRGTGLGVIRTLASTLGAGGPVLFGIMADRGHFDEAYLVLAAIMAAVVLLTLRMPRS